ncbi:Uncharacterised protein [Mycobacteroides abscessus subsp. abscessus]|nr:Uncharacterised protein [Mycobacteroides abscessus subsp. abscessus]
MTHSTNALQAVFNTSAEPKAIIKAYPRPALANSDVGGLASAAEFTC